VLKKSFLGTKDKDFAELVICFVSSSLFYDDFLYNPFDFLSLFYNNLPGVWVCFLMRMFAAKLGLLLPGH